MIQELMIKSFKNIQFELKNNWTIFLIIGSIFLIQIPLQKVLYVDLNETFFSKKILSLNYIFQTKRLLLVCMVLAITFGLLMFYKRNVAVPIYCKVIIGVCIFVLTWSFSLYEYNYYFNQWHLFDRVLLITLGILSIRYPFIIIFFVIQAICISKQFTFPKVLIYTYTDKKIIELNRVYSPPQDESLNLLVKEKNNIKIYKIKKENAFEKYFLEVISKITKKKYQYYFKKIIFINKFAEHLKK